VISSDADSRVVPFRSARVPRTNVIGGKAATVSDTSPVPDLSKYECPESEDDYRHRMLENAIALVFVSLLSLAGLWLVHAIAHI